MRADFHIHTNASDGYFTPAEVVKHALAAKLSVLSVTDHDTVFNTLKVNTLCENCRLKSVAGVEISAYIGDVKIHTLGYGFDPENVGFLRFLETLREGSEIRAAKIIEKLNAAGVKITYQDAAAERDFPQTPLHAMHIARAAVKKGYEKDRYAFYKKYMMFGRPAYSNIYRPSPEQAISEISAAGGIAVIAHPGRIDLPKAELYALIKHLASAGLKGIEAVYATHTVIETAYFKELAEELGLYVTGGSDCHFAGGGRAVGEPEFHPSAELRQRLKI